MQEQIEDKDFIQTWWETKLEELQHKIYTSIDSDDTYECAFTEYEIVFIVDYMLCTNLNIDRYTLKSNLSNLFQAWDNDEVFYEDLENHF